MKETNKHLAFQLKTEMSHPLDIHLKQAKLTDRQYKSDQQFSICERQRAPTGVTEIFPTLI